MFRTVLNRLPIAAKVLLLSVHDEGSVISGALEAGADGLVLTREIATDLLEAVDALVAGRRYVSRGATV